MSLIALLLWLVVFCVVMYVFYLLATKFIVDVTLRSIVLLVLGLIFLLILLGQLGVLPSMGLHL